MSNQLQENLNIILEEKNTKIIPQNIKAGVEVLGVTGELESGIKRFNSENEMLNSEAAQYGDLAIVYNNEMRAITQDAEFSYMFFPEVVVLDEPLDEYDSIWVDFRPVDTEKYGVMDSWNEITGRRASFSVSFIGAGNWEDTIGSFGVSYTSDDGQTYIRTNVSGSKVKNGEIALPCKVKYSGTWRDLVGKFVKITNDEFNGLYSYTEEGITTTDIYLYDYSKISVYNNERVNGVELSSKTISIAEIEDILNHTPFYSTNYVSAMVAYADNMYYIVPTRSTYNYDAGVVFAYNITANKLYVAANQVNNSMINQPYADIYIYNPNTGETVQTTLADYQEYPLDTFSYYPSYEKITEIVDRESAYIVFYKSDATFGFTRLGYFTLDEATNTGEVSTYTLTQKYYKYDAYTPAFTQLTAKPGFVYRDDVFYGLDGVETGTLLSSYSNNFDDAATDVFMEIQNAYDSMEPFMCTDSNKPNKDIKIFPGKTDGTPLINVSQVTDFESYFLGYEKLEKITSIDFSNVRGADRLLCGCPNLTYVCDLDFSGATSSITGLFINDWNLRKAPFIKISDQVASIQQMFDGCTVMAEIPEGMDFSHVTVADWFCSECKTLKFIPDFNFNSLVSTRYMFKQCDILRDVPQFNFDKVTQADGMFLDCPALSDNTLNNILAMCGTNTVLGTKTLAYIGLTQEQAERCMALSNFEAFTNAGWTTGY